ncbi:MAG: signal peptidase I [Clostridia bacterium]|nr:signal peptidase I [Clostridia bacterium]NCC44355.1 signal peptidase I [Clostridia bacterium]
MSEYTENPEDTKKKTKKKRPKKSLFKELAEDILLLIIVLGSVFILKNYVLINAVIPSGSMENTILIGDRVFGNRLTYEFDDPKRGDIVIFKFPDDEKELYIKRVIGLPGDTVLIKAGKVYINGSDTPLDEPYLAETPEGDYGPYEVPEGRYFMLGDNRNHSADSRFWEEKYVEREKILAKAALRYYPLSKIGFIS